MPTFFVASEAIIPPIVRITGPLLHHLRRSLRLQPGETLSVTDRSYIIHEGQVIAEGTPRELINDPRVRQNYLGSTFRGDEFDEPVPAPSRY